MEKWIQFFRAHERALLVIILVIAGYVGYSKWVAHKDATDHDQAVISHERVQVDTQAALQAAGQVQQLTQANAQLQKKIDLLQSEVQGAIATRNNGNDQRKHQEISAPLDQIATRWTQLVQGAGGGISVGNSGIVATDAAARSTVQALEDGSVAEANYQDLSRLDAGKDAEIKGLNALVDSETNSARAQQVLLAAQLADYKTSLQTAKDDGKKNGRKSFWHGLAIGAGAVAAIALRFL